jgi:LmbE family N-acetylglucosaminyl deacetylase
VTATRPHGLPTGAPGTRVAVISPHLDDAILSLGATIAGWARSGSHVVVVTVLANDPDLSGSASPWDSRAQFTSSREAAAKRRMEDARACAIVGADTEWLPFGDKEHPRGGTDNEIKAALQRAVGHADALVAPGYPLTQAGGDHLLVTRLALALPARPPRVGLYVEQPYAANRLVRRLTRRAVPLPFQRERLEWNKLRPALGDWRAKQAAIASYGSQRTVLGPFLRTRIALYELASGGEAIAWLASGEMSAAQDMFGDGETHHEEGGRRLHNAIGNVLNAAVSADT